MPPKAKFSKEEIIQAALEIVRTDGMAALTARALGTKLGSSARPVFTVFQSMEEVQQAAVKAAKKIYNGYVEKGMEEARAFKGVGTQYILFAIEEPKLFQLLFMREQENVPHLAVVLPLIDENYQMILSSIEKDYPIGRAAAQRLYHHLWIYTHGIASLCATKMCSFTPQEINGMMTEIFVSLLKNIEMERKA
ncbi:MAG: TetR/AcrR family transcriptional regulator [Oscillospiraceae bacterium]|nr:TetR/AcrR family transcriptional regulator [Oscillospiraceae bacterium]